MKPAAYDVGDTIEYTANCGTRRRVRVDERDPNIKHGHPGFDGTLLDAADRPTTETVWGYDDQITRVERRAKETK